MNRPETAFLLPEGEGFSLRWFTPVQEVDLCGHATLASAHVLWEIECLQPDEPAVFFTKSGRLTAWRSENGTIWMDFPAEPPVPCEPPTELLRVLGSAPIRYVGRNRMDYLVLLDREATVRTLRPDLARLQELDIRGLIVTAPAEDVPADFVSRFFAPRLGVPEDPVTGSAIVAWDLLGRAAGPHAAERLSGVGTGRPRRGGGARRTRAPGRPGRHGAAGQAALGIAYQRYELSARCQPL